MSVYRAKSELTRTVIEAILNELAVKGKQNVRTLLVKVRKKLSREENKKLKARKGNQELWRILYYLNSRGYIKKVFGNKENAVYNLTTSGWRRLEDLRYVPLAERVENWDGKWRVVAFDIPENKREIRDAVRRLIKHLGFVQLRRSVWVQPLECTAEIEEIKNAYDVAGNITLMTVDSFDGDREYRKLFAKKLPQLR